MSTGAGKGDKPRKVNTKVYGENYDAIFRKPKIKTLEELKQELKDLQIEFDKLPRKWDSFSGENLCSQMDIIKTKIDEYEDQQ